MNRLFSWSRWFGIVGKEFIQLKRDRLTFAMIVGIPVAPAPAVRLRDQLRSEAPARRGPRRRPQRILAQHPRRSQEQRVLRLSSREAHDDAEIDRMLATGAVQFVVTIPEGFSRALVRGERPALLIEADATDPAATGNAIAAVNQLAQTALTRDLIGPLAPLAAAARVRGPRAPALQPGGDHAVQHRPGLMGVILTMTMVLMTGLAITRETERGTMENLLATPASPLEVMTGKIVPVRADRTDPGLAHPAARAPRLPRADPSAGSTSSFVARAPVHRGEPDARPHASRRSRGTSCRRCR